MNRIPDTYWTIHEELALFGGACLLGAPVGVLFDALRVLRRCIRHPAWAVAAEDILWLLLSALLLLCYASACAKGVFRGYYAAGTFLGFALYELTLGNPTVRLLTCIGRALCLPFHWLRRLSTPICTKMRASFVEYAKIVSGGKENTQKRLQSAGKKVYNKCRYYTGKIYRKGTTHGKN